MVLQETWWILIFFCYLWIFLCAYSLSKTGQWSNFSLSAGTLVSIWNEVSKVACLYVQPIILINLKLLIFVYLQFTGMALSNSSSDIPEDWFLAILLKAICSLIQISVASVKLCILCSCRLELLRCSELQKVFKHICWLHFPDCTFWKLRGLFCLNGSVFIMKGYIDNFGIPSVFEGVVESICIWKMFRKWFAL